VPLAQASSIRQLEHASNGHSSAFRCEHAGRAAAVRSMPQHREAGSGAERFNGASSVCAIPLA